MKIVLGNFQLTTPVAVQITKSMSDAISKCSLSVVDNNSSLSVTCPQELIVIDDQVIPNPTINLLQNPSLNPYTLDWFNGGTISGITQSSVGGGGITWTFNNAANGTFLSFYQFLPQATLVGGQSYMVSFYAVGVAPVNFNISGFVKLISVSSGLLAQPTFSFAVPTTLTRFTFSFTAPAGTSFGDLVFEPTATSNTNSGTLTITHVQYEPQWFVNQSYPTPWCGPSQANCRQLPSGLWIRQYRKFAGLVVNPIFTDYKGNVRTIQINAVGYAWLLSTIYSNKTYTNRYDSFILSDLFNTYLTNTDPRLGGVLNLVGTSNIVQGVQLSSFVNNWDDLKTVADSLASQIGFYWTIDDYWEGIYAPPGYLTSSNSLTCDNSSVPDMTITFPADSFQSESDYTQPGANILVIGSGSNVAQVIDPVQINNIGNTCGYFLPTLTSWMRKVNASSLNSVADCNQRGIAELIQYDVPRGLYQLNTDACELIAGQSIQVTSSTDTFNGAPLNQTSLLLQDVTATWIGTSELLQDKWQYQAKLGAVNRQVPHILSRLFRSTNSNSSAPAIAQTALVAFERIGIVDTASAGTTATGYQATILGDSPIAYYRLDEAIETIADDFSGNANAGTLHGGITLLTAGLLSGSSDTAMTFDGSTGYISLPTTFEPTGAHAWSLEGWVQVSSIPANNVYYEIIGYGTNNTQQSAQIKIKGTGSGAAVFMCSTFAGDITGASVATGIPYHVVGTYDGTNTRLYVNGFLVAGPTAFTLNVAMGYASIGADGTSPSEFLAGIIDEPAIYSVALSDSGSSPGQILTHYMAGTGGQMEYDTGARGSAQSSGWGPNATDGNLWTLTDSVHSKTTTTQLEIFGNVSNFGSIGTANSLNCTVLARISIGVSADVAGVLLRFTNSSNYIKLDVSSDTLRIRKNIGGTLSNVATTSVTMNTSTEYWFKFNVGMSSATTYNGKFWQDGTIEPTNYMISGTASDAVLASGKWGLFAVTTTSTPAKFDNFKVTQ